MLDAVIPIATYATSNGNGSFGYTAGVTKNAYLDTTAKTVGYAYLNNIVAQYDGTYWKPLTNPTKILSGDFATQVNIADIGGVASNGLIYTGTSSPFNTTYTLQSQFGVTTWSSAVMNSVNPRGNNTNICESRGMLLPLLSETNATTNAYGGLTHVPAGGSLGTATGIPNHPSGWTWTSSSNTGSSSNYWLWNGGSASSNTFNGYDGTFYIRCVR